VKKKEFLMIGVNVVRRMLIKVGGGAKRGEEFL